MGLAFGGGITYMQYKVPFGVKRWADLVTPNSLIALSVVSIPYLFCPALFLVPSFGLRPMDLCFVQLGL